MNHNSQMNPNRNSNHQPICEHDRQILLQNLSAGILQIAGQPEQLISLLSPASIDHLINRREVTETTAFIGILFVLTLRGATAQDVACYATTGHGELPFRGCEQALFDCLLNAMLADIEPPATATAMAKETTAMLEHMLELIAKETGIIRPTICEMAFPANPANDNE